MKPVQSSPSEHAGDLLPAFASKGAPAKAESFQAALAIAINGMGQIVPTPPSPPPVQSSLPQPAAGKPAAPTGEPVETQPVFPLPLFESHPTGREPVVPPSVVVRPPMVAKPGTPVAVAKPGAPVTVAKPNGPIEQDSPDAKNRLVADSTPAPVPPAEVVAIVAGAVVPKPVGGEQAPALPGENEPGPESKLGARTSDTPRPAKPAVVPSGARSAPAAEPRRPAEREDTGAADLPAKQSPAESHHVDRTEASPVPARVRVTVEEINVEGKAPVAPPPVKDRKLQRDVEAVQHIAESPPGAPHPDGVPAQAQRASPESPASTADAPAQLRHADDAPANPGTMDRVTLHLPDDAGGGRIQIAVRGDVVHARIVSVDEAGTMEMQSGLDELRGALTRQGFQETHVRVETRPASDAGWMPASAAREAAGAGDSRPHDSERQERQARDQRQPEEAADQRRQQADGRSHQRSRRERER